MTNDEHTTPDLYADVQAFNRKLCPTVDRTAHGPSAPDMVEHHLGAVLCQEELEELMTALGYEAPDWQLGEAWHHPGDRDAVDVVDAVDAICDTIYVLLGMTLRLGVSREQFHAAWREVQRANMAKEGGPTRADGKILKPEGWTPPDIAGALGLAAPVAAPSAWHMEAEAKVDALPIPTKREE